MKTLLKSQAISLKAEKANIVKRSNNEYDQTKPKSLISKKYAAVV